MSGNQFEGRVPPGLGGRRLEEVLLGLLEGSSRSAVARLVRRGKVRVNGRRAVRSNLVVEAGWRVSVDDGRDARKGRVPAVELEVVFEDEFLAVVNKPAGLLCHGMAEERAAVERRDLDAGRGAGGRASLRGGGRASGSGAGGRGGQAGGAAGNRGGGDRSDGRVSGRADGRSDGRAGGRRDGSAGGASGGVGARGRGSDFESRGQLGRGERGASSEGLGRSRGERGGQGAAPTLAELAVARFGRLPMLMGEERPGIVHRLDRETSGLIVVAKTGEAMEGLREAFRARQVEKAYLAVVHGAPEWDERVLDWDLVDGEGDRRGWREAGAGKQEARTGVEVVERSAAASLVVCRPEFGRRHQIRVHLFAAGFGIVGDKLYRERGAGGLGERAPEVRRHMLHAVGLGFAHPVTGEVIEFEWPPPEDMGRVIDWLSGA